MNEGIRIEIDDAVGRATLVAGFIAAMGEVSGSFEDRERAALQLGNELVRQWIERELQTMARELPDEVTVADQRYRRHARGTCRYHTLCGPVVVERETYRAVGVRNGPTVVPLELRAGVVENATPALAFSVTQGFAERPFRHYEAELAAAHRYTPSRSTLERIGKRIGAALDDVVTSFEPEIRAAEPLLAGVHSISFGLDRTTVPMAEVIAAASPRERRIRRPPPPITVNYRMAYVGTVSLHDRTGTVLLTKRFAATPQEGPQRFAERIGDELKHLHDRYVDAQISVIQDGAPELWNLVEAIRARTKLTFAVELIDRFHVDERLAAICDGLGGAGRELRVAWHVALNRSDTAIDRIVRRLDALVSYEQFGQFDDAPAPTFWKRRGCLSLEREALSLINGHLQYLHKSRRRLRYAGSLRRGLPIGSGPTEGACKSVVTVRFKRSGQRWFESGLAPCISLRALHLSDRLRPCFARLQATRYATLRAA